MDWTEQDEASLQESIEAIWGPQMKRPDAPAWVLKEVDHLNRRFLEKMGDDDA